MKQVNIHEAKTHFSALIGDVQEGEEIVIATQVENMAIVTADVEQRLYFALCGAMICASMSGTPGMRSRCG